MATYGDPATESAVEPGFHYHLFRSMSRKQPKRLCIHQKQSPCNLHNPQTLLGIVHLFNIRF